MLLHWFTLRLAGSLHLYEAQKPNFDASPILVAKGNLGGELKGKKITVTKQNIGSFVSKDRRGARWDNQSVSGERVKV